MSDHHLRFPIGEWSAPENITTQDRALWISNIVNLPNELKTLLGKIDGGYERTYRPGGWNITQLIHHLADSHMNALIRFKLTLTEDSLLIKPYAEDLFAQLADYKEEHIPHALSILDGVHAKLGLVFNSMNDADFKKYYVHPEYKDEYRLDEACSLYSWHGKHHLAHIQIAAGVSI